MNAEAKVEQDYKAARDRANSALLAMQDQENELRRLKGLRAEPTHFERRLAAVAAKQANELTLAPAEHGGYVVLDGARYGHAFGYPKVAFAGDFDACASFMRQHYAEVTPPKPRSPSPE